MDKARILIVEDERLVAADIGACLEQSGHEVLGFAASGLEALQLVSEKRPDLVLMDIMLEGVMDGIATATAMRSEFNVSIIYLTALWDEAILQRAKLTEPLGYVLKPFEEALLKITIEMALHRRKMEMERDQLRTNLEEALRTVKTLRGLLPICASCKKIRDQQGAWMQMELYISSHSDARFSHGFCPQCYEEYLRKSGIEQ